MVRETVAGDRTVRGAVRQETEPCGGWAVRGSPRHEPNRGGSVRSVRTAVVCGTVVNNSRDPFPVDCDVFVDGFPPPSELNE